MKTKEFIEQHLKKIYENCSVYFDIQEKGIVIKNEITKEAKAYWDEKEPEFKRARVLAQQAKVEGRNIEVPILPHSWEDIYKEDKAYNLGENYFRLVVAKLDEWETNQNRKVENVSSLIEFLEWFASEEEELAKMVEEIEKKRMERLAAELERLEIEEHERRAEEAGKKLHPDFTLDLQELWKYCGFNYETCKEWIEAGLKPKDCFYARWLKHVQQASPSKYKEALSMAGSDRVVRMIYRQHLLKIAAEEKEEEKEFISKALSLSEDIDLFGESEKKNEAESEVKNILLIGRTGSGKSTLANVLVNKNGEFEPVFKESSRSISETKNIQTEKFTVDLSRDGTEKINYLVIDTAGFGDTQLDNKEILGLLKDLVPIIKKSGLNQIFFVTNGRFSQPEIETYKLLETVIFDREAPKYTTIIRTNFDNFEDDNSCEEDRQSLREENLELFKILKASKIIYVNNPPLVGRSAKINREVREESRKRLLTHLGACQNNYHPTDLENLNERIESYINSEEELKKEIELKEKLIREEEVKLQKEFEVIQKEKERDLRITGRNFERRIQELKSKNQQKLQTTRQEFETIHQVQLQKSQQEYNEILREVKQTIQNNLNQIRNSYNYVEVGKPVCRYGHDRNIRTYDKSGSLIPDYQSDFIGHIYCPTCGSNDYNFSLRDAKTYSLEEWSRKNSQHAAERRRKMQEAIDEQNRKEQEIINRINQEKANRDAETTRNIQERKRLQEQIDSQQEKIKEELIEQQKQISKGKIASGSQEKINRLKREFEEKKQALDDHIRQSEEKRNNAQQELFAYIERRKS